MDKIIDALTAYTIENGMLTCVTTVVALVCVRLALSLQRDCAEREAHVLAAQWLSMPTNLIFLGLHFAISKRALSPHPSYLLHSSN